MAVFATTHWSVVLCAGRSDTTRARDALASLCQTYWHALYAYVRRRGHAPADAEDLTQEFFARLLEQNWIARADQQKGRFRSFLLTALNRFLADEWDKTRAQKRGGGRSAVSLDTEEAERRYCEDSENGITADRIYDRQWALILLANTLKKLEAEFVAADKGSDFETLKPCLLAEHATTDYGSLAQKLGVNAGAARVAVHRLRKRFRQLYREEISQTLSDSSELEAELRHLAAALACQRV